MQAYLNNRGFVHKLHKCYRHTVHQQLEQYNLVEMEFLEHLIFDNSMQDPSRSILLIVQYDSPGRNLFLHTRVVGQDRHHIRRLLADTCTVGFCTLPLLLPD